jgi:hypothetical protein
MGPSCERSRARLASLLIGALVCWLSSVPAAASTRRCESVQVQLRAYVNAIAIYMALKGGPPPTRGWYDALETRAWLYDPWGSPLVYRRGEGAGDYTLLSVGADGELGTSDDQIAGNLTSYERCRDTNDLVVLYRSWRERALRWWRTL